MASARAKPRTNLHFSERFSACRFCERCRDGPTQAESSGSVTSPVTFFGRRGGVQRRGNPEPEGARDSASRASSSALLVGVRERLVPIVVVIVVRSEQFVPTFATLAVVVALAGHSDSIPEHVSLQRMVTMKEQPRRAVVQQMARGSANK